MFQHLPIYFGKTALVLGSGRQTALGRKQRGTVFGALFEEADHFNPQWESNTCNYIKLLGFLKRNKAITRHDLASRKVITVTIGSHSDVESPGVGDSKFAEAGTLRPSLKPCIEHLLRTWLFPYILSKTPRIYSQLVIIPVYNEDMEALSWKEPD